MHSNIPDLDGDSWSYMWDVPFKHLVSASDRHMQFKILHWAYFTPSRLNKLNHGIYCWQCAHEPGVFRHIFWACLVISQWWSDVIATVNTVAQLKLTLSPRCCSRPRPHSSGENAPQSPLIVCLKGHHYVLEKKNLTLLCYNFGNIL